MIKKLKILSTLSEAELQADYTQVLEGLAKKGHEVYVFLHVPTTSWNPQIPWLKIFFTKEKFKIDRFSILNSLSKKAIQCINKCDINVIYATGTRLGEGLIAAYLTGKPILCDVRNPWSIQWKDWRKKLSPKTVIGHHIRKIRFLTEEKLIHKADAITAYSSGIKHWLISNIGVKEKKITVIPPHVDIERFNPNIDSTNIRNKFNINEYPLLMYVGTMNHGRGMDVLLDALYKINCQNAKAKLMLIGPLPDSVGPYLRDLKKKIHSLGLLNDVIFTGFIPFDQVPIFISACDICVIPHRYNFTFKISPPVKILEYMASQKPIVTTNVGIEDFIEDRKTGLVVEPEDPVAMANAINHLLQDAAFASQIAKNGRQLVERKFRKEKMVDKFETELLNLVA